MLTKKYVFRPAWLLYAGPGLLLAMLLAAAVVLAADRGLISTHTALGLQVVPNLILAAFCRRWSVAGRAEVKPNQVVLQGRAIVLDQNGRARRAYVRHHIPKSEWHTLQVSGLLLATLTWTRPGETIVLERLSQPYLLRHLLHAERRAWASPSLTQRLYTRRARGLALLRAFALLRLFCHAGLALVRRLHPRAAPGLERAVQHCLRHARRLFCALRELPAQLSRRPLYIEEIAQPGFERAWFARLLKDVETSALPQRMPLGASTLTRRVRG